MIRGGVDMARLTDPEKLRCYLNALANWRYFGFVDVNEFAQEQLDRLNLGLSPVGFRRLLHDYVQAGGGIDQVAETRPEWSPHWEFHYDLRPTVGPVRLYVETRLKYKKPDDPDDPVIIVVNIHHA